MPTLSGPEPLPKLFCFLVILIALAATACQKDPSPAPDCQQATLVDKDLYNDAPADLFSIVSIDLRGDCLEITFAASGCDGETWVHQLIDSEAILYSLPPQRVLRMSLEDNEECEAVIRKTVSFDLSHVQLEEYDRIVLNIDGYEGGKIEYAY